MRSVLEPGGVLVPDGSDDQTSASRTRYDRDEEFEFGLDVVLDSLERLLARHGGEASEHLPARDRTSAAVLERGEDNLVATQNDAFGLLKMTLHEDAYTFEWVLAPRQPAYVDTGTVACS